MLHFNPKIPVRRIGILLAAFLLAGFSGPAFADRQVIKMTIDDVERSALVFAPKKSADTMLPLVLVYHGRGDDSGKFARAVKLHKDWKNAVVVYPRGLFLDSKPKMRGWQGRVGEYNDRDLKFTDRLLQRLQTMYPVDPQRTYVAGFSSGGHFTFLLLRERTEMFVAYSVIGALQPDFQSNSPAKPFIFLFGRDEGSQYQEQWVNTVKALARHNRASGEQIEYEDCCTLLYPKAEGATMVYGLYSAGHIWPYSGNQRLMRFFKQASDGAQTVSSGKE
ncbi:MAG: alpha/beta hydrolase-fold protein [Gammaproteobacteria bacterium]|nr:alpha/beta hydrolase-fold protein [Gammaproteobacteria bacterium]